jgi:hypothetical protein
VPIHHIEYSATVVNLWSLTVDEFMSDEHYEIQLITDHWGLPGSYEYLVHWNGYDDSIEST